MTIHRFRKSMRNIIELRSPKLLAAIFACLCLASYPLLYAQVGPAAIDNGFNYFAGATVQGATLQYGDRKMAGFSGFLNADSRRHLGFEAEGRWLMLRQTADVHAATYLLGLRYRFIRGRFLPYAKGLAGEGVFDFPYGYAHGNYFVVAGGGGIDYRVNHRLRLRLIDCEYQYWPQFTYGAMSSVGIGSGISVRIFR